MAITATYLTADLSASGNTMTVNSGTGFPAVGTITSTGYLVRIDKEFMRAIAQPVSGTVLLSRLGQNGTAVVAHDKLAKVEVSSNPADFANAPPGADVTLAPYMPAQETIGEDVTFTSAQVAAWGNQPRIFTLTKATAAAIVLVAPSKAQDGLVITFTSTVAVLNVITATSLLANGATGSPYTTATGADSKIGATLTLQAQNGLWNVASNSGFTLS